jgi:hypothetical protein
MRQDFGSKVVTTTTATTAGTMAAPAAATSSAKSSADLEPLPATKHLTEDAAINRRGIFS